MSRVTLTFAALMYLTAAQTAAAQHAGFGGLQQKHWGGQPRTNIAWAQGGPGQKLPGQGWQNNGQGQGGNNDQAAAEFWGAIGRVIEKEWKKKHPPQPWPPVRPTPPGPTFGPPRPYPVPRGPDVYVERQPYVPPTPTRQAPPVTPIQTTPTVNIKPPATKPQPNEIKLVGRPLTEAEVQRAKEFFRRRLDELTRAIGCRLPQVEVDMPELMAQFIAQAIAAEVQIRILDLIRRENFDGAHELWIIHCPGVKPPFRRSRICVCFVSFCARLEAGTCTARDGQDLEQELIGLGLADHPCCGAPSLLEEIQECLLISQAVARATPGIQTQTAAVPPGDVDIIYHPSLPDGGTIVLDGGAVMLGTGGVGTLHMQHGNVAQQQGYPLATGLSLEENNSPLVTSGIVIENLTQTAVHFDLGNQHFSLEPLGRKTFSATSSEIAFRSGNGREVLQYSVYGGTHRFLAKDTGWGFQRIASFEADIDNSNNSEPFHYIVQGKHQVVAPHSTQSHSSAYPLVVRFDRGNGSGTKQVVIAREQKATLTVGVNPADNLWDMFAAAAPAVASQPDATSPAGSRIVPAF